MSDLEKAVAEIEKEINEVPEVVESAPVEDWIPDYKFKVMDKEYEIDEFLRPAINKDNYDKIKDLYTKSYGLEHEKARAERYKSDVERLSPFEQQLSEQNKQLGYMGNLLHNKEYGTLFKELKIPDEAITAHALDYLKFRELPPDKQREYEKGLEDRQRSKQLEIQNQELSQQIQIQASQARERELDNFLSGQIKDVVEQFDSRVGRQGAFKDAVWARGKLVFHTEKKDISVREAVEDVLRFSGVNPQAPGQVQTSTTENYTSQRDKPIIPNIRGSNQSPVKKQISSIADLQKVYNSKFGD